MPTAFPGALDAFNNPSAANDLDTVAVTHNEQHTNVNDAVEALELKVGITASADTGSLDYKVTRSARVWSTTYANDPFNDIPSLVKNGDLWMPTDGIGILFQRLSGAWSPLGSSVFPLVQPSLTGFAWINQGSATVAATKGGIYLYSPGSGSGLNIRAQVKTAPATPYVVTAHVRPLLMGKSFHTAGICFRESSTGRIHALDLFNQQAAYGSGSNAPEAFIRSTKFSSPTSFSASYQATSTNMFPEWLRIADDGSNRVCFISRDGQNWLIFHTIGRTDFLTANQIGFYVNSENSAVPNLDVALGLLSWQES